MEPNESANPTPTNEAGNDKAQNNSKPSQPSGADNQGTAAHGSADQQSSDGKSWTESANVQKVVEQLPQGVRDFFTNSWSQVGKSLGQAGEQVNKLTTAQKVAGAVALAGIGYLALRSGKSEKSSGMGSMYRGDSSKGSKKSQRGYRSGSYSSASYNSYSTPSATTDESKRMDRGPGHYSSFDRQNESRVGGSYQSGSGNSASGSGSQSSFGSSSGAGNQSGSSYRGTSGNLSDSEESDFGSGV